MNKNIFLDDGLCFLSLQLLCCCMKAAIDDNVNYWSQLYSSKAFFIKINSLDLSLLTPIVG